MAVNGIGPIPLNMLLFKCQLGIDGMGFFRSYRKLSFSKYYRINN